MDADTLRAILSAQAAAQEKMLQAVMKEMRGMFSSMTSTSTTAHATSAEFVTNSLSARLPEFTHDSENGCTFDVVYWPSMEADIEKLVRNCATCAQQAKDPVKTELQSWPKPLTPWTRVHADFAGPLDGNFYLVIVDAFSKWPEIIQMNSITTSATIKVLTKVFAQFGNPQTLVTDNGTQFTSATFVDFCRRRGIKHVRSPPFHPQSNGQAERFVDTFKRGLAKLKGEEPTTEALQAFLMAYRSTPCPSGPNHLSPAENFLGRRIRTELDLMMPSPEDSTGRRDTKMEDQFNRHQGAKPRHFDVDDAVYAKDYRQAKLLGHLGSSLDASETSCITYAAGAPYGQDTPTS
nr:Integrase domain containing protein [Haemonchus contortus]